MLDLPNGVLVSLDELGVPGDPVEDGETFETNARIKARFGARATGLPTLSDDSGIEVDALGGGPGVRTRRYAGEDATDQDNNDKLLGALEGLPPERRTRIALERHDDHSYCGDDWRDCEEHVASALGLPSDHWRERKERPAGNGFALPDRARPERSEAPSL